MQTLTNENVLKNNESFTYAGFFTRMLAYIIDLIIVTVLIGIIKLFVLRGISQTEFFSEPLLFNYSLIDIIEYFIKVSYFIISLYCAETTVGKYVMKLKVVKADGGKLSLFNIIYRETIGRFISSFICIGYLLVIIDKDKAALHDKLCDSRVIYACNIKKTVIVKPQVMQQPLTPPPYNPQFNQNNMPNMTENNRNNMPNMAENNRNNMPNMTENNHDNTQNIHQ